MSTALVLAVAQAAAATPLAPAAANSLPTGNPLPATPGIGSTLIALLLVLGLIVGLAWLLRRMPGFSQGLRGGNGLRVASSVQVGSKERVVVVTEGDKRWLLGVTAQQISLIEILPPAPPIAAVPTQTPPSFVQALMRATGRGPTP